MAADFSFGALVAAVSDFVWAGQWNGAQIVPVAPMVALLLGAGLYLMLRLKFKPLAFLPGSFSLLWKKDRGVEAKDGEISPLAALMTALSGQIGTGKLAGVATAITIGGPGAIFWMWVTALFGMGLAFAEAALAVRYRRVAGDGEFSGGPMYYIRAGLGPNWAWLSGLFCLMAAFYAIASGNMVQANSLADAVTSVSGVPEWVAGLGCAALVFMIIIGGIRSIGAAAETLVPAMSVGYVALALVAIGLNIEHVPGAFRQIFVGAFEGQAAVGGFVGAGVIMAIRAGVARGLFSNEAGQGSTPMAHAAARTQDPARQGKLAIVAVFIDTIVICTMTALVLLTVQGAYAFEAGAPQAFAWTSDLRGFDMTSAAFDSAFPAAIGNVSFGRWAAAIALILFAFTTIITWAYYGERALVYLFGAKIALPYRLVWVVLIVVGSFQDLELVWRLGEIASAAMAAPNLIALILLAPVVVALAKGETRAGRDFE